MNVKKTNNPPKCGTDLNNVYTKDETQMAEKY